LKKNEAFEAVIGVLGVVGTSRRGGGVQACISFLPDVSFKASIFAAIGVLSGRRLNGGNFRGWRPFLARFAGCLPLASGVFEPLVWEVVGMGSSLTFAAAPLESESLRESTLNRSISEGKLDLRTVAGVERSISVLGDSNALGIAGTGGTSSSAALFMLSTLGLGVGNRDEENDCDNRGWKDPLEFRVEL
jgi:hypothetical protein